MNIFYLDEDPAVAAGMMCDKHVVKMILESAQMLCTAHRILDGDQYANEARLYKKGFVDHPSTVWARASRYNYEWLWNHMAALLTEYTNRYGKVHATERLVDPLWVHPGNISEDESFSPPPQCMPDQYKCDDTVQAYRNYYLGEKMYMAKWDYTEAPSWAIA
jgi:hypothetical protein